MIYINNKNYYTLHQYNLQKYGGKMYKAVIDAGFTCPNKDGYKGKLGCTFCHDGSGYFTDSGKDPENQLENEVKRIRQKHENAKICAYFQAHTNTYADVDVLKSIYTPVLKNSEVSAVSIATRADCLQDEIVEYLVELSKKTDLTVELGLQTIHDKTAKAINRCHDFAAFVQGFNSLKMKNIRTCVHIINGLPDESDEMMLETAKVLGSLKPDAVKIQMLHIVKGTAMAKSYSEKNFPLLSKEEYVDIVTQQLEFFPENTVIERLTGDGDKSKLIAPLWTSDKISVLGMCDKVMKNLSRRQGNRWNYNAFN